MLQVIFRDGRCVSFNGRLCSFPGNASKDSSKGHHVKDPKLMEVTVPVMKNERGRKQGMLRKVFWL